MKSKGKISILHIVFLSMTVIGLKNHVTIIPSLLSGAERDSWMSIILSALITVPWLYVFFLLQKQLHSDSVRTRLLTNYPKFGNVVIYVIVFYLILMAAFTMRETLQWVSTTFLIETPVLLLFFLFSVVCLLLATSSVLSITMANIIVLFGVVVLGFFVAFVNLQVKDHSLLRPFFEHGYSPIIKTVVYPASGFFEILLLLFIQQHFTKKLKFTHLLIILFILVGLTLGPLIGAITEFGPTEAARQRYPAFEEWRIAKIGNYVSHLDFFSIYQWLTGTFIRVGFLLYIAIELLGMTGKKKKIWEIVAPAFIFLTLPLFLINDSIFIEIKGKYFLISTALFFFILAFLLLFLLRKRTNSKVESDASN
ncbi:endospore germination permease [Solibacillus sp. MA9]|uniref:Endospore germination permease n=1 Tax=Solibacillus palustris TaxID=2908203 RepID=A0ABS9UF83_9BACL|nr:endospore germination permease [Solibacillus sp. MA9]MCH7322986.1 endospore germination permease [Solibacillus sp. MA9]